MITLSASKISTWLQCPRKFQFRYVARIPVPWRASSLALGSAVHGTLETFHQERAAGMTMTPDSTSALFQIDLAAELADTIRYKEDETAAQLRAQGESLVRLYAVANRSLEVEGVEVPFELELVDGIVFRGVFDVLLAGNRIRELKTAGRAYDHGTLGRMIQLSAYAWAFRELSGSDPVIEVIALLKLKHPRMESYEVTRTRAEEAWFIELVVEVAKAIELRVFPPNPGWACDDCEYAEPCQDVGRGR